MALKLNILALSQQQRLPKINNLPKAFFWAQGSAHHGAMQNDYVNNQIHQDRPVVYLLRIFSSNLDTMSRTHKSTRLQEAHVLAHYSVEFVIQFQSSALM